MVHFRFSPGATVGVRVLPGVIHLGIATERLDHEGYQTVISGSARAGNVAEEPMSVFSAGRDVFEVKELRGNLPSFLVVDQARTLLGQPYKLFSNNCEHVVRKAQGLVTHSSQLALGILLAGTVLGLLALRGSRA
jgi:hypothetical protein